MFYRSIPFIEETARKISNVLEEVNLKPAFTNKNNLNNLLVNNKIKEKEEICQQSGVYQINCSCGSIYIGKTKRNIFTRFLEHKKGAKQNNCNITGLSQHLKETGHKCDLDQVQLLKHISGGRLLDKFEVFEIMKAKENGLTLLNSQIDFTNRSPLLSPSYLFSARQ